MTMAAGDVTIAADAAETKSGLAGALYDALKAEWIVQLTANGQTPPADVTVLARVRKAMALQAKTQASAIVAHITANAQAVIKPSSDGAPSDGLQKAGGSPTTAPDAEKTLTIR